MTARTIPARADAVVIGGGIVGLSAAWQLLRSGHAVTVVEKGKVGDEQSGLNLGYCRTLMRDEAEIALILESLKVWKEMQGTCSDDLGFRTPGIVALSSDDTETQSFAAWKDTAARHQHHVDLLTTNDIKALLPELTSTYGAALHGTDQGWAEPRLACPALKTAIRELGGVVLENCAVRGLKLSGNVVTGVETQAGPIDTTRVLCAAGAWSTRFARNHGIELKQLPIVGSLLRLDPSAPRVTDVAIVSDEYYMRPMHGGGYAIGRAGAPVVDLTLDNVRWARAYWPRLRRDWNRIKLRLGMPFLRSLVAGRTWDAAKTSPFDHAPALRADIDHATLNRALAAVRRDFPALRDVPVAERWSGIIDVTPDALPVIGAVAQHPGLFLATGFSGHGFGLGPGAGRLAAKIMTGEAPCVDTTPFRVDRFA